MKKHNLGYPRIGSRRELKKACEEYWSGQSTKETLQQVGKKIRQENWRIQQEAGIDLIPCNDFSFYDHVLDMSLSLGVIPEKYTAVLAENKQNNELDLYFAMARGYQKDGLDLTATEMTKWFDTNYHYLVPEFIKNQKFEHFNNKIISEFYEAKEFLNKPPKPVLIGPVTYLLLGKEKEKGFHRLELLDRLLPVYEQIFEKLAGLGAEWIQLDEPFLVMNLSEIERQAYIKAYSKLKQKFPTLKFLISTYFECTGSNIDLATSLEIDALHVDLVRCPSQLSDLLATNFSQKKTILSLGLVDGRNIWKNDYERSLNFVEQAVSALGKERIWLAPSCSLLHSPNDLTLETNEKILSPELKNWMAFAKQKLQEIKSIDDVFEKLAGSEELLRKNKEAIQSRKTSTLIHKSEVKQRVLSLQEKDFSRKNNFATRQNIQQKILGLPLFPTTTIGSFPQTEEIRVLRNKLKKGDLSVAQYEQAIEEATVKVVQWQEENGIDVLVHGEYERNDMVEYFGEQLGGFTFTENGWVQSYGSRCVKPPIIYGDVYRPKAMTVRWSAFAQSKTKKHMKGMLTGPVTILQWSFVRDDQPRSQTAFQIGLSIRDEVSDLEKAGIKIIQIDEPAIREGLPLRKENQKEYLEWAVKAFRLSASSVEDQTQIHTHMCYSEFNDIISNIADMDADVITIETSRSQMELLEAFSDFNYPNEIGPGVYDIHSPRIPSVQEMVYLLEKAATIIPARNLWVNPDCGLKTRKWPETAVALQNMVKAAMAARAAVKEPIA